ncbi:hypothetical protein A2U01_0093121, partial [Trifolium medium]|nr:hypothetical protein [Trifolium medium]
VSEYDAEQNVEDILDSEDDNRQDVGHDVVNIGLSGRKKIHGKKIPQNIPVLVCTLCTILCTIRV